MKRRKNEGEKDHDSEAQWWDRERRGAVGDVDRNGSWDGLTKACGHHAGIVEPGWVGEGGGSTDGEELGVDAGDGAGGHELFDNDGAGGDTVGMVPTEGRVAVALGWWEEPVLGWCGKAVVELHEEHAAVLPIGEAEAVDVGTHPWVLHVVEDTINLPMVGMIGIQGSGIVLIDVDEMEPWGRECVEGLGVDVAAGLMVAEDDGLWDGSEEGHPCCGGECATYSRDKNSVTLIVTHIQSTPVELWTSRLSSKSSNTSTTSQRQRCQAASHCDVGGEIVAGDEGSGGSKATCHGTACVW
jgi:hypothetical protein